LQLLAIGGKVKEYSDILRAKSIIRELPAITGIIKLLKPKTYCMCHQL
jgi:hypothetical protein